MSSIELKFSISEESIRKIVAEEIAKMLNEPADLIFKAGDLEVDSMGRVTTAATKKEVVHTPPMRGLIPEVMTEFIKTGDISELASIPDVKTKYRTIMFAQLNDLRGRTLYGAKASTQRPIVGIMKDEHWTEEQLQGLKPCFENEGTVNAVIMISGTMPEMILDILVVPENWSSRGRLFNSLWRADK